MTDSARFSWTVLLPVKVLARAKSRLTVLAGDRRGDLALALASDTVTAVLACPEVARVVVVTSDPVAGPRLAALGAIVVEDEHSGELEERFIVFGMDASGRILGVAHTVVGGNIRIISAREATRKERAQYEDKRI